MLYIIHQRICYLIRLDNFTSVINVWFHSNPDSKIHGANMGPTWVLSAPDGPHVGPMNLAIRERTRRSENDNTPQPLDQWTNSSFIGQQVGNCKSFTLTHYFADLSAMHRGRRSIPLCIQHHIQLTSFHSKWVKPPIVELQQFPYFTLKIQGQGHGWGQSLKSQCESNILSTHIPFVPFQWAIPFLQYDFFKIWPWKSKVKVMVEVKVQSHKVGVTSYRLTSLLFHVNRPSHSWDTAFSKFWPWKSKVKVMSEGKVESHNMGPTFYRLTSLSSHVNRPSHSWDTTFSKFDLENPRSMPWLRWKFKVTKWV